MRPESSWFGKAGGWQRPASRESFYSAFGTKPEKAVVERHTLDMGR